MILGVIIWEISHIPQMAAEEFGEPAAHLTLYQRYNYAFRLFLNEKSLTEPGNVNGSPTTFHVEFGESPVSIGNRLEQEGFIIDAEAFRIYLIYSGLDTGVQAGDFQVDPTMNAVDIAHRLQDATPDRVIFNIFPGWRTEEVALSIESSGLEFDPQEFIALAYHPDEILIPTGLENIHSLEGFFFPAEYDFKRDIPVELMNQTLTHKFSENVTSDLVDAYQRNGLSLFEAVTLASIIEREAVLVEEQPLIASVFFNRLSIGMKLESDPTVQYALGYNGLQDTWWTNPLSIENLSIDSPYNTYKYAGLPSGPISNPGISALSAVAYPAQTKYFYFRADCDGSGRHQFAYTFEEHVKNECP
ncbi:MAG: endolytic transglycosylase MltG [Anaerolineaceae bacterium]|nr:endolytic transglycosylase MltG [Anaerolineaceae bacterium]